MGTLKCSVFQQHINIFYIKIINIMATFEVNYTVFNLFSVVAAIVILKTHSPSPAPFLSEKNNFS